MKTKCLAALAVVTLGGTALLQAASTIQFTTSLFPIAENGGTATLTIQRTNDLETVVTVDYASSNVTATAGADYLAVQGTLTFAAGETNQTIAVPILNDGVVESMYESLTVTLSNPTGRRFWAALRPLRCGSPTTTRAWGLSSALPRSAATASVKPKASSF